MEKGTKFVRVSNENLQKTYAWIKMTIIVTQRIIETHVLQFLYNILNKEFKLDVGCYIISTCITHIDESIPIVKTC